MHSRMALTCRSLQGWMRARGVCGVTFLFLLLGSGLFAQAEGQSRRWLPAPVLQANIVDRDGTHFGNPTQMVALPAGGFALVHDYVEVHAFDSAGELGWKYGRYGEGPHEFGFIQDIDVSAEGEVFILDRYLGRVSVIDGRTGRLNIAFRLPSQPLPLIGYGILPGHEEARALVVPERGQDTLLWVAVSDDDRRLGAETMPLEVDCGHQLVCEHLTTVTGSRGSAVAFRRSNMLLFLEPDGSVRTIAHGVEAISFPKVDVPRVDPRWPTAVIDFAADSLHLFVLFAGLTEEAGRIVDVYSVVDGDYRGSFLFPGDVSQLAILSDGRLATLDLEYFPTVSLWELTLASLDRPWRSAAGR